MNQTMTFVSGHLSEFFSYTAFANFTVGHIIMLLLGLALIALAIVRDYEPMLLVPIGFGILIGNIPFHTGLMLGIYEPGSVMSYLYLGISKGIFPSLIFLGIGAMTDFTALISNPKLILIGAATQLGIFGAYMLALYFGFGAAHAGAIGIIGGADGPTSIFLASRLAPELIGAVAICAYAYMALAPIMQPPVMRLLTSKKDRLIRMKPPRVVSKAEKIIFPIVGLLLTCFVVPAALPLLGMLFFGNLLKESTVTKRLADTAKGPMIDIVTILIGLTIGASAEAGTFFTFNTLLIFSIGAVSFVVATLGGVILCKVINIFLKEGNKINPLIGNAGVAAVPGSAKVSQNLGLESDKTNHLLMHAMGPNMAGLIGSAVAAGILLSMLN